MAKITASMVADLRSKTGAGMMDCKKALSETDGNIDDAIDFLRKKGLSAAAKKSGRVAAEGAIVAGGSDNVGVIVEVNAETDFVAKNDAFCAFASGVAQVVAEQSPLTMETLQQSQFPNTGRTVAEELTHQISTIGENINIRRFARREVTSGVVETYVHAGGKIGVVVELTTAKVCDHITATARQIAMHIAAASPQYLCREDVPAEVVDKEKEIMRVKALASGKPENIVDKIIAGQINKFYGEICLLEQAFVIDPDLTITKVVAALAKEIDAEVTLSGYDRYLLGEGIEKRSDDFAAEVASLTK